MNVNYNDHHQWKTTCTFYKYKKKKIAKHLYIYTKIQTLCKKQDNLRYVLFTKIHTLTLRNFHENFEFGIYIEKAWHFAVCDVFIYKKGNPFYVRNKYFLAQIMIALLSNKNGILHYWKIQQFNS